MNAALLAELISAGLNVAAILLPKLDEIRQTANGGDRAALDALYERLRAEADFVADDLRRIPPD
jgi:hypothetical protein